jgi:glycosyltransferase involved in cell wall biosynthesis
MKSILIINPGPNYKVHSDLYKSEYQILSNNFRGFIFTTSSKHENISIERFTYISMKSNNNRRDVIKFFLFCIWHALRLLMQGDRFDMVITYDPLKSGLIGLMVAKIHNAKFISEVNGVYTSPAIWLDEEKKWENKLKKYTFPIIMRYVFKHADGIRLLYKEQINHFFSVLQGKVIRDFHCFVPTDRFKNIRENKEVLFAGFPFKTKGVDVLIEAFKKIAPKYPDWKLKILGWYPNPDELYKAINSHPQIYHHPPVKYDQMIEHIGTCAILVLPSRSEAMGRVLVEAMASEKPRIGSNVDGIPTVINDGVDGFLVEPGNVNDLARKLDMLMGDPALRRSMGLAGKARIPSEFTQEMYIRNVVNLYKEVLNS